MSNPVSNSSAVSRLASQSDAIGRLAQDSGGFAAVVAAFESKDANAFRWVLERLEMLPYCELICEWIRIKLCVLRCVEVCSPLREKTEIPDLPQFARAVVKLSSNEKLLRRVVDAISCGDGSDYRAALDELKLGEFCELLCYWVCSIGYDRVCEIVCRPQPVLVQDPVSELRAAGDLIGSVIKKEKILDAIAKAAVGLDSETLPSAINGTSFGSGCEIICRLICVWRAVWVCRELCELRPPILTGAYAIEEAQNFALAARQLADQPRVLGDLVNAVQNRNAAAYREIVSRFNLIPYCWQVCAWVGAVTCWEFCVRVCPPPALQPMFTTVGDFHIYSDIDGTTGRTNKSLPPTLGLVYGGGPNFAFDEQLQLGGFCPSYSPTSPSTSMQYRFLYATASTTLAAALSASATSITVGSGASAPAAPFYVSLCNAGGTGETMQVTAVSGTTWNVLRGQEGTTATAAVAGAMLWINPTAITGSQVYTWQVGTRMILWPQETAAGTASSTFISTQQAVYVTPNAPPLDPTPPASGATWVGPSAHYIQVEANGWVPVDQNAVGGGFSVLLSFDTTQATVAPGGDPLPGVPAGTAVPLANQRAGTDLSIIFQAAEVAASPTVTYSNSLCNILVNNWSEVNELNLAEFGPGCCTPIDKTLSVEFTVDHEEMNSGAWSIGITSCSPSAPGYIICVTTLDSAISATQTSINVANGDFPSTPFNASLVSTGETITVNNVSVIGATTTLTVLRGVDGTTAASAAEGAVLSTYFGAGVTLSARGGYGTIVENTSDWCNCSYTVTLTTRPGLTTGLEDRTPSYPTVTFAICDHSC